eukprot:scaffold162357_cov35-Tisochrysis_lutea.AAC.2
MDQCPIWYWLFERCDPMMWFHLEQQRSAVWRQPVQQKPVPTVDACREDLRVGEGRLSPL